MKRDPSQLDIVNRVRVALVTTVLALGASTVAFAPPANAADKGPTPSEIAAAIKQAEQSRSLWATVNICQDKRMPTTAKPDTIGIRAQMPSLGFAAWLSMGVQLDYYSATDKQFEPLPQGGTAFIRLGRSTDGLQQAGHTWQFSQAVLLDATVQFFWRRQGKLLGQTTETTTAGHPTAAFAVPLHYSAKQCSIP